MCIHPESSGWGWCTRIMFLLTHIRSLRRLLKSCYAYGSFLSFLISSQSIHMLQPVIQTQSLFRDLWLNIQQIGFYLFNIALVWPNTCQQDILIEQINSKYTTGRVELVCNRRASVTEGGWNGLQDSCCNAGGVSSDWAPEDCYRVLNSHSEY